MKVTKGVSLELELAKEVSEIARSQDISFSYFVTQALEGAIQKFKIK